MLVAGVSIVYSRNIVTKFSDSYPIKVIDGRSHLSKGRPVGSRHRFLGRISAKYVLTQAYFDIKADASIAEIPTTDFKPS